MLWADPVTVEVVMETDGMVVVVEEGSEKEAVVEVEQTEEKVVKRESEEDLVVNWVGLEEKEEENKVMVIRAEGMEVEL